MKKIAPIILTLSLLSVACIGIFIATSEMQKQQDFHESFTLVEGSNISENWNVNVNGITPGKTITYTISFTNDLAIDYNLYLGFDPQGETELAKYINVDIFYNDEKFNSDSLLNYFDNDFKMSVNDKSGELIINYSMPIDTDNAAQGTKADFSLNLVINS